MSNRITSNQLNIKIKLSCSSVNRYKKFCFNNNSFIVAKTVASKQGHVIKGHAINVKLYDEDKDKVYVVAWYVCINGMFAYYFHIFIDTICIISFGNIEKKNSFGFRTSK